MSLLAATATYSTAVRRTLGVSAPIVYASRLSHSKSHPAPAKLEKQEIDAEVLRKQLPADVAAMLQAFPSIIRMPVRWGDQDAYAHINNVIYARYMEHSRIAYLWQLIKPRLDPQTWSDFINAKGQGIIASNLILNFRKPLEYPEYISIGTRIPLESIKSDRFEMHYALVTDSDAALASDGHCTLVTFDYRMGKKCHIPDAIRKAIEEAETPFVGKPLPASRRKPSA